MNLYLLRHGRAESLNVLYTQDHARPLTAHGADTLIRAAPYMADAMGSLERIFTSPMTRALQTARIVGNAFKEPIPAIGDARFDGTSSTNAIADFLEKLGMIQSLLVVGHAPNLDRLIAYLVAPTEDRPFTKLRPGALARVELDLPLARRGTLHWIVPLEVW